jgi:hypothetical protein
MQIQKIVFLIIPFFVLILVLLIPIKVPCGRPSFICSDISYKNGTVNVMYEIEPLGTYLFESVFKKDGVLKYNEGYTEYAYLEIEPTVNEDPSQTKTESDKEVEEQEKVANNDNPPSISFNDLEAQEICEQSGGKLELLCPDCQGCPCTYLCSCEIERYSLGSINLTRSLVNKGNVCFECEEDADCGGSSCSMARNMCRSNKSVCADGVCLTVSEDYGRWDYRTHNCENDECIPCYDNCWTK